MDRLIYTAMTGASQTLEQQSAIANNLANVSVDGFRAQLAAFRAVPLEGAQQLANGDDKVTRTFVVGSTPSADFTPGPVQMTGNPLDVAVSGSGWLTVQDAGGNEAYTRAGNLHVSADGQLLTAGNLPVIGNGGPISVPPAAQLAIGKDGTISVLGAGDPANAVAFVDKLQLVNPDVHMLQRGDDGMFRMSDGSAAEPDPAVQVTSGAIEGSNVNAVSAMAAMIANARQFEMQMKLVQQADNNDQAANQLLAFS